MAKPKQPSKKRRALGIAAAGILGVGTVGHFVLEDRAADAFNEYAAQSYTPSAECLNTIYSEAARQTISAAPEAYDILVVPGFTANDAYMSDLRSALESAGHSAHGWDGGVLWTDVEANAAQIEKRINEIYAANGGKRIAIVGYSLGGVYAREASRNNADKVSQVVTLSAPINLKQDNGEPDPRIQAIHDIYDQAEAHSYDAPLTVPTTAIASSSDLIVDWIAASIKENNEISENLHAPSGHVMMPFSDGTARLVLDRLAEPQDSWQPAAQKYCRVR